MIRITAINDESEIDDEDENQVTKEAEETIAISEYTRALRMKNNGRTDIALNLLNELLEAQVVFEITKEQKKEALFSVKYNSYKNIGFIYEEQGEKEKALDFLLKAIELDDTDVYTMNKLGQLALGMEQSEVALMAFEKCLKKNPNHWPSGDGILQILCQREDYNEAYGWALMWYNKNPEYERGLDVILEIREKFEGGGLEYIENCWSIKFKNKSMKRVNPKSVFPECSFVEPEVLPKPDIEQFQLENENELTWLTLGNLIVNMYEHFEKTNNIPAVGYTFDFKDLFKESGNEAIPIQDPPQVNTEADGRKENGDDESPIIQTNESNSKGENSNTENSNTENVKFLIPTSNEASLISTPNELNAEDDSDSTKDETGFKPTKQSRRRGSDLKFLEQWCYWDRGRKHSQRRKSQQTEKNENEVTINGILRKILAKYFEDNFDTESPLVPDKQLESNGATNKTTIKTCSARSNITYEEFQYSTTEAFFDFINELKSSLFSTITLVRKWAQYMSKFWEQSIPQEIQYLYIKIYSFYLNHHDICGWASLDPNDYQAAYRMTLFYLELFHDRAMSTAKPNFKNEVDETWFKLFNYLIFQSGFYEPSDDEVESSKYQKRLYWLQYSLALYENDLDRSVNCLIALKDLLNVHNEQYKLEFPNQSKNNYMDLATVDALIVSQERTISLNSVPKLYVDKKWKDVIVILKESLIQLDDYKTADCSAMRIATQIEVILECFWNLESFDECFVWSERCLKYALDCFVDAPKDSFRQDEWGKTVSFILTYIETLFINESYSIVASLGKYYSRLIQSVVRIVSHQLDSHFEKNNNQLHPVDIKMPWVILHHILQREEDLTPKIDRKLSTDSAGTDGSLEGEEELGETIPNSIMIFFTAHEYLGARSWCTKDAGKLLLYTLDVVVPRLRTPYLEPFREFIAEYLEQVTYCLYGYPAKKARVKHIEEHDAQNVDLTWDHAVQLFDLYRPDQLPEFNSYKNDSITNEMEQLLQRIIVLMPSDIDPSSRSNEIEKFISGQLSELPNALNIVPYRVQSIFYLLADYYFKNRDFSKSVKYYVLDLNNYTIRFDSWAGLALSKASLLETKLNSCTANYSIDEMIQDSEEVLRCFEQCLKLDDQTVLLWIEYGNYAYALHSFCSRSLKQSSDTLSMERFSILEEKKEQCLKVAFDCFTTVDKSTNVSQPSNGAEKQENDDGHDEKWLYHYMLGKIAEKRKEQPNIILEHYLKSAKLLYEHNATYPFKISYSSPQNLALEALEIFYRITAAIIKYVELHSVITRAVGKYFIKVLKGLSTSPFALSQAKINENSINAFKRKITQANEEATKQKVAKTEATSSAPDAKIDATTETQAADSESKVQQDVISETTKEYINSDGKNAETEAAKGTADDVEMTEVLAEAPNENQTIDRDRDVIPIVNPIVANVIAEDQLNSPLRRGSQESTATTTTTQTTTTDSTSSSSSDSSSGESSSSDSDDSSSGDDANKDPNAPLSESDIELIYKMCIKNFEECISRFPEHFKSIYRLVLIYLNAPERIKDAKKCEQLLLGTYTTAFSASQVQGLFTDRKNNNLFNGIWRNPSSEIDRPGSFSAQLSKCVIILLQILRTNTNYKMLIEIVLQLQKAPDQEKWRYIKDSERKELCQQAMFCCSQAFKELLKRHSTDKRDDNEILKLLLEVYHAHKKCLKLTSLKESVFSPLMVEAYKVYIQGKVERLPENINVVDLAIKLCVQEVNFKKNLEKQGGQLPNVPKAIPGIPYSHTTAAAKAAAAAEKAAAEKAAAAAAFASTSNVQTIRVSTSSVPYGPQTTTVLTPTASPSTAPSTPAYTTGPSRPRGRPPGSKNSPPTMPSLNPLLGRVDPTPLAPLIYSNPAIMTALTQFTDPASLNAFLAEVLRMSSYNSNMAQITPSNLLSQMLLMGPPTPSVSSNMQPSATTITKLPQHSTAISKSPQPSLTTITKLPQQSATITKSLQQPLGTTKASQPTTLGIQQSPPIKVFKSGIQNSFAPSVTATSHKSMKPTTLLSGVPSTSSSMLKTGTSTVITVASGELTITPSLSVTPKNVSSQQLKPPPPAKKQKVTDSGAFSFTKAIVDLTASPPMGSPTSVSSQFKTRPPNIPSDLPKSLSIIPTSLGYTTKPSPLSKPTVTMQTEKVTKQTKAKKKPTETISKKDHSKLMASTSQAASAITSNLMLFGGLGKFNSKEVKDYLEMFGKYEDIRASNVKSGKSYMSQFEDFVSVVPSSTANQPTNPKSKQPKAAATATSTSQPRRISLKALDTLQYPKTGSTKQSFVTPDSSTKKTKICMPTAYGPTVTPIIAHSPQKVVYPTSSFGAMQSNPSAVQISPTKTLQQKLAERKNALNDVSQQVASRPSSASSTGSNKTRKSDSDVIILD